VTPPDPIRALSACRRRDDRLVHSLRRWPSALTECFASIRTYGLARPAVQLTAAKDACSVGFGQLVKKNGVMVG
jgi:hypothetical protein